MKLETGREMCRVRGEAGSVDLVCWTPSGWLLGDGRVVPPSEVLDVRCAGTSATPVSWTASTFSDAGFAPVRVRGHLSGRWQTDRGCCEVIHQPVPKLRRGGVIRGIDGKALTFHACDLYEQAAHPYWDSNHPGPAPYECSIVGYRGGCWEAADGQLFLPQDLVLCPPLKRDLRQFERPIRCLDGTVATGYYGDEFFTGSGPKRTLSGPIPPSATICEARIAATLRQVPEALKSVAHRQSVTRHLGLTASQAAGDFGVQLPQELLFPLTRGPLCPVGAFLRWCVGFTAAEVALLHPPEFVDYRARLDSLVARVDPRSRSLWDATQAGDADARRNLADRVEEQGDRGRAALLRRGEPRPRYRGLDDEWCDDA